MGWVSVSPNLVMLAKKAGYSLPFARGWQGVVEITVLVE